jgi:hypothetical protein
MADYVTAYTAHFDILVRPGAKVDALTRKEGCYLLPSGNEYLVADRVVATRSLPESQGVLVLAARRR